MKIAFILVPFLGLLLFSFKPVMGQRKIDSLVAVLKTVKQDSLKVKVLNQLAYQFRSNNPDTAIFFANEALALAKKNQFTTGVIDALLFKGIATKNQGKYEEALKISMEALVKCDQLLASRKGIDIFTIRSLKGGAYSSIGNIYDEQGKYTEALKYNFAALKIREELGDKASIASSYNNIGNIYAVQGNSAEALKNYFAALKIKEKIGDKGSIANSYNNIGSTYYNQREYQLALKYHSIALKIREEIMDKRGLASSYNNIGVVHSDQGNLEEAMKCHIAALQLQQETGDLQGIALSNNNLGLISMREGDYEKALSYFRNYLNISEEIEDNSGIADANINIGIAHLKLNHLQDASRSLNKGLQLSRELGSLDYIKYSYEYLTKLDSAKGDYKQALEHYKLFITYRDSLFNEENTRKMVQSQMEFEFEKKESLARAEQEKKDIISQRQRNMQYSVIALLGILVLAAIIIAIILWRNNRQKQNANGMLARQKAELESTLTELRLTQAQLIQSEKMASLGELTAGIAHEIQNPLNFVNNFSEVNAELIDELKQEIDKGNLAEVKALADDLLENEKKINHHGRRADAIVKGMLQHSRVNSGTKEPTSINALADEYLRLAYHGLRAKDKAFNATLITDFDESISKIDVIPQDLGRVILNLITNAFYAVNEKKKNSAEGYEPTVSVSTKRENDKVVIVVKDNGNGIPQKLLDKIFQPFFTTKPTGEGTGLGLSISYEIITKGHKGEMKVETEEGEGSRFIILLPE